VPVEGLPPSTEDIRSGAYYLARTLYLGARAPLTPQVRALVDFVASPAGQEVVAGRFAVLP
jgi:ABC-type phosphate transport system substrate-binding protein